MTSNKYQPLDNLNIPGLCIYVNKKYKKRRVDTMYQEQFPDHNNKHLRAALRLTAAVSVNGKNIFPRLQSVI